MSHKSRDVIIVLGKTGFGKSVWTKSFTAEKPRLLVFDPAISFDVEFGQADDIVESLKGVKNDESFRMGIFDGDELSKIGNQAFLIGKNHLVIEECSAVFKKGCRIEDWMKRLIFLGRHQECTLIFVAQRATSIPIDLRSQANWVVSFQQHEGDDLAWLKDFFGMRVKELPFLPKLNYIEYKNGELSRNKLSSDCFGKGEFDENKKQENHVNTPLDLFS